MTTLDKILKKIISFLHSAKEKVLANEGKIFISIVMSLISLVTVTVILIVIPPFLFLNIIAIFSEQGKDWQSYFEGIGIISIIVNIIFAFNIKKAEFMRKYFIDITPSPKVSIPIGIIVIIGFTIYKPFMYILFLFLVYLNLIKKQEE